MKNIKKNRGKLLLAGAFLLVAFALWFTRPMTPGTMFPGFDPNGVTQMNGNYTLAGVENGHPFLKVWNLADAPLDEEGQTLFQALSEAKFRRDVSDQLYSIFSSTHRSRSNAAADYCLRMYFYGGGGILNLDISFGWLSFTYYPAEYPNRPEQKWYCSFEGHEELFDSLCAYIKTHGVPKQ